VSEPATISQRLEVQPVGDALRARIRRGIDLVIVVGAAIICVSQAVAFAYTGETQELVTLVGSVVVGGLALAGLIGRAAWTSHAYAIIFMVGNVLVLLLYGPLLGMGVMYLCAFTFVYVFLSPIWRWGLVVGIVATPLILGALYALAIVEPAPTFEFADASAWARVAMTAAASMVALALIVGYTVRQLVSARLDVERVLERSRETRHERARVEAEIARTRSADLIVELAAEVGADIGAALRTISARAEALAGAIPSDAAQSCLADVIASAQAAGSTMRSLTVFAPEQGEVEARCDAARVAHALPQIVRRMIPRRISLELSADDEAWVALGGTDLLRIFTNLVLNARDAIAEAGTISLKITRGGSTTSIEVRDDGAGMDEATRARVFQPFFTTKPVGRGTGLGLATAKILVERAGGTIEFVSELGRGTCFTIRLPRATPPSLPTDR